MIYFSTDFIYDIMIDWFIQLLGTFCAPFAQLLVSQPERAVLRCTVSAPFAENFYAEEKTPKPKWTTFS